MQAKRKVRTATWVIFACLTVAIASHAQHDGMSPRTRRIVLSSLTGLDFQPGVALVLDHKVERTLKELAKAARNKQTAPSHTLNDAVKILWTQPGWYCDKDYRLHNLGLEIVDSLKKSATPAKTILKSHCEHRAKLFQDRSVVALNVPFKSENTALNLLDDSIHACPLTQTSQDSLIVMINFLRSLGKAELAAIYAMGYANQYEDLGVSDGYLVAYTLASAGFQSQAKDVWNKIAHKWDKEKHQIAGKQITKEQAEKELTQAMTKTKDPQKEMRKLAIGENHSMFERAIRLLSPEQLSKWMGIQKPKNGTLCPLPNLAAGENLLDDSFVSDSAMKMLSRFEGDLSPKLLTFLKSPDEDIVKKALDKLMMEKVPEELVIKELGQVLTSPGHSKGDFLPYLLAKMGKPALPELMKALNSSDPQVRKLGALGLSGQPFPHDNVEIIQALVKALKDSNPQVRDHAVRALVLTPKEHLDLVILPLMETLLHDKNPTVKDTTAYTLAEFQNQLHLAANTRTPSTQNTQIVDLLKANLGIDKDLSIRRAAALGLSRLGTGKANTVLPELIKVLKDRDPQLRSLAARALGGVNDKKATKALAKALMDSEASVRLAAAYSLNTRFYTISFVPQEAISNLTALLEDEDSQVRRWATVALGNAEEKAVSVVPKIIARLKDPYPKIREAAALALRSIPNDASIPHLINALEDVDPDVRKEVSRSLGWHGKKALSAIPLLIKRFKDQDRAVQEAAAYALGDIGAASLSSLLETLKDEDARTRKLALYGLRRMGEKAAPAVPRVIESLKEDKNPSVQAQTANTLGAIGPKASAAVPELVAAMKAPDSQVRRFAAIALGEIGVDNSEVSQVLAAALTDSDETVRQYAKESLEKLDAKR